VLPAFVPAAFVPAAFVLALDASVSGSDFALPHASVPANSNTNAVRIERLRDKGTDRK